MTELEAYKELKDKSPTGFKLNELIAFSYPVRKIKIDALVNKQPDGSLVKVYNVPLRAIQQGFNTQKTLFQFLGLGEQDEFILRELFLLKEKNYVDLIADKWIVAPEGEKFLENEKILRVEEHEDFEFLLDGISGDVMAIKQENANKAKLQKFLTSEIKTPNRSPEIIENKFQQIADTFKQLNENKCYLISYDADDIKFDSFRDGESGFWMNYWLVEYIPEKNTNLEAKLEVRNYDSLKLDKTLSAKFNSEYRHYIYSLSSSDRTSFEELAEVTDEPAQPIKPQIVTSDIATLTIWETKHKFLEALHNVKEKILIESPWIKRATMEYLPLFEKMLKDKKQLIILYGISEKDEHDYQTLEKVKELQRQNKETFTLIHLPTHFDNIGSRLTGTHRKLVIKDYDYYIAGSFNFLSFGKNEKQQVANEESMLISKDVQKKWEQVMKEYSLNLKTNK
ncbi:MAG: hypothetical protein FJY07_11795 [Bacteroidetes bacterium]|nr:hypothetical protein [Bacteroidota bacterium]